MLSNTNVVLKNDKSETQLRRAPKNSELTTIEQNQIGVQNLKLIREAEQRKLRRGQVPNTMQNKKKLKLLEKSGKEKKREASPLAKALKHKREQEFREREKR